MSGGGGGVGKQELRTQASRMTLFPFRQFFEKR